jgi:predicted ATPase/class 3 adenylate cyclase
MPRNLSTWLHLVGVIAMTTAQPLPFGALLKRLRRAHGLTQEELAERAGYSPIYISMLERGARMPLAATATLLAGALELTSEEQAAFTAAARRRGDTDAGAPGETGGASHAAPNTSASPPDAGVHTFLIADVRGYTRFTHEQGDEAAARLAATFAQLARECVEMRDGQVLELRGDEALAVFVSARQALRAAVELQARCAAATAAEPSLPLPIGIGLDVGEAVPLEGGYRGGALNLAARLCSVAGPGEVLASAIVAHLAQKVPGLAYRDRGTAQLKGLAEPVHVVRVLTEEAAATEPLDYRLEVPPHKAIEDHLPLQLTSFVGRERELAEVKGQLSRTRLLTLTGAGGSGKTRLALEAAADLREQFPQGAWLVELAALTDPQLVANTTAQTLGIRQDPEVSLIQLLVGALRARRLLIVLDTCEHLLLECAQMAETLLHACPQLHILATSREALHIPGETVWSVPPLSRPEPHPLLLLQDLLRYEAVMLFVERARAAAPTFAVTGRDVQAVAAICARLDGLPLAIELAAARITMLSVGELAARLDGSFRLLTGGSRTALPRQQTLKATLDWSHQLLALAQQVLFRRLAVFAGPFTLRAVEQVASGAGMDTSQALDLLTGLVEQSLVIVIGEAAGETRYRLLEPIRQYAWTQLEASGEADEVQERHAQCFLAAAEAAEPHLEATDQAVWLERLDQDRANLRAALQWFAARRQVELGLRLASALWKFWFIRGYVPEGRERFADLLTLADEQVPPIPAAVRAQALNEAGVLARYASDYEAARTLIGESLRIRRTLGDPKGIADALANLGYVALQQGDYVAARSAYEESLAINRALDNRQGVADAQSHLAFVACYEGDLARAHALDEESLTIWRALGDRQGIAWALHRLGNVALRRGDEVAAAATFTESLRISQDLGLRWGIAWSLEDRARLDVRHGSAQDALHLAGCAAALRRRIGIPMPPRERTEFDAALAASWEALGPVASAVAWSEGETMPLEQAVEALLR